ncbi:hypothetical protein L6452_04231 [Arctium lappa]|uniref:Uncharacterized protein n=1 Tax=Arctium lappa TaxID=4217 RepID=A0ACB9FNU3_ARCLA|nr:hypothetical protein L6452_04231 [Arctium lappa]
MTDLNLSTSIFSLLLPFTFIIIIFFFFKSINNNSDPKSYPLIRSLFSILQNRHRYILWTSELVNKTATKTAVIHRPFGRVTVVTANPSVVRHMLKTNIHFYPTSRTTFFDLLGDGIFNVDGDGWKYQRQVSCLEFATRSLRHFVEHVVDAELNDRFLPILATSADTGTTVIDFQDLLQRFALDSVCRVAFGYDPTNLLSSLPEAVFATACDEALMITAERMHLNLPLIWKLKRLLNVGSEKRLRIAIGIIREFANKVIKQKKLELEQKSSLESVDLLSRFMTSGNSDENLLADIIINFIFTGRETTPAALTWLFWLLKKNPSVETELVKEIKLKSENLNYDEVKDMVYTHASLCESMRLCPPVAVDDKFAAAADVLPDGTVVKRGYSVSYHVYAMGRSEELWGFDWAEFRPERWLEKDVSGRWRFKPRDAYEYPVFQAGPRVCLGREMAFLQMKRVVAGVLRRFRVVPARDDGVDEGYVNAKMKGGFPVRIEKRDEIDG